MSIAPPRPAKLLRFYHCFLQNENVADFVRSVSQQYTCGALERLATSSDATMRRSAVLGLSLLGDFTNNAALGRALSDTDRAVRLLAESGIREVWLRDGAPPQQQLLRRLIRLNDDGAAEEVRVFATRLISETPTLAEAWNQRAVAWYLEQDFARSARDCRQTLELNPYHFPALVGLAHCQLEMTDPIGTLQSLRRALAINPQLDGVREQARYLERALEDI